MTQIVSICIQTAPTDMDKEPYQYSRTPVKRVVLKAGHGIEGDLKAGKQKDRHVNLMFAEDLQHLGAEGFKVKPGQMGEQIVIG